MEFTTGEETEPKDDGEKTVLTGEELGKQLDRLLQDKANNQRIRDWVEVCVTILLMFYFRLKYSICIIFYSI